MQVVCLSSHHLSESPQRCTCELPGSPVNQVLLQNLRAAGDEPDSFGGRDSGVDDALDEGQGAGGGPGDVFGHFLGRRICSEDIQCGKVHHAFEGRIPRQFCEQLLPVPSARRACLRRYNGRVCRGGLSGSAIITGQYDCLAAGGEVRRQVCCCSTPVGGQYPNAWREGNLFRPTSHNDTGAQGTVGVGIVGTDELHFRVTGIGEGPIPSVRCGQCVVFTVVIRETPPAVQQPEGQVLVGPTLQPFKGNQLTRRSQQIPTVSQRFSKVPGGVQYICSDDEVVAVGIEALVNGVCLYVQGLVFDGGAVFGQTGLGLGKEACRYVCKGVVEPTGGQQWENGRRSRTRPRPDFDNPQMPVTGQSGYRGGYYVSEHGIRCTGRGRPEVEVGGAGAFVAE